MAVKDYHFKNERMKNKKFNLKELAIDGKELGNLYHESSIQKFVEELIYWGVIQRKNNNIFRKNQDELNESWMDKIIDMSGIPIDFDRS